MVYSIYATSNWQIIHAKKQEYIFTGSLYIDSKINAHSDY